MDAREVLLDDLVDIQRLVGSDFGWHAWYSRSLALLTGFILAVRENSNHGKRPLHQPRSAGQELVRVRRRKVQP
jgi:hypothetical protein